MIIKLALPLFKWQHSYRFNHISFHHVVMHGVNVICNEELTVTFLCCMFLLSRTGSNKKQLGSSVFGCIAIWKGEDCADF